MDGTILAAEGHTQMQQTCTSKPVQQIPGLMTWGFPPFVPTASVVAPHTGPEDMAKNLELMGIRIPAQEVPVEFLTEQGVNNALRQHPSVPKEPFQFSVPLGGMGQYQAGGEGDILGAARSISQMYESMKPMIDFIGGHPWKALAILTFGIIAGGAVGGYIGAGLRVEQEKRKLRPSKAKRR